MDENTLKDYEKACQIAADALNYGRGLIKQKSYLLDTIEKIEGYIRKRDAGLAFPTQISPNHIAAHFYPSRDDKTIFEDALLKLDVGVEVNGYIGDNACTIDLSGRYDELVRASEEALSSAIGVIREGTTLGEIGEAIQGSITGYGFVPVRNLGGHGLDQYQIHTHPSIPNIANNDPTKLTAGQIVAIEPFASMGAGLVVEASGNELFQLTTPKPVRDPTTKAVLDFIYGYNALPFAKRWLLAEFPEFKVNLALKNLLNLEILREYPPLADKSKGMVSQAEHTIIVEDNKARILTRTE
jgi:methionyl aminopeptidase